MKKTSMLALALLALLVNGPVVAETTTPLVPNDVGHWLNLEQRTGRLAPDIWAFCFLNRNSAILRSAYTSISKQRSGGIT